MLYFMARGGPGPFGVISIRPDPGMTLKYIKILPGLIRLTKSWWADTGKLAFGGN